MVGPGYHNPGSRRTPLVEEDVGYWGEVIELPGCFASGRDFEEFKEALLEAIVMCAPEFSAADGPAKARPPARLGAMVLQT